MTLIKSHRPSPWMLVAVAALVFAMVGTAIAGTDAVSKLTKSKVRSIANKEIDKRAPGLSVNKATEADHAKTADTATTASNANALGGRSLGQVRSVAASGANAAVVNIGGGTNVVATNIDLAVESRVLINGVAELSGASSDERAQCFLRIDGSSVSLNFETTFDDIGDDNEVTLAAAAGPVVAGGAHTVDMRCAALAGTVTKDDAAITVTAVPTP
jgi:hypothetical protein